MANWVLTNYEKCAIIETERDKTRQHLNNRRGEADTKDANQAETCNRVHQSQQSRKGQNISSQASGANPTGIKDKC